MNTHFQSSDDLSLQFAFPPNQNGTLADQKDYWLLPYNQVDEPIETMAKLLQCIRDDFLGSSPGTNLKEVFGLQS